MGAGRYSTSRSRNGLRSDPGPSCVHRRPAVLGGRIHDRELDLVIAGIDVEEQFVHLVHDRSDTSIGTIDFVDQEDDRQLTGEGFAQDEAGLGEWAFGGVDQQHHPVDHGERPLHFTPEVGVAGRIDDVEPDVAILDRGVLGQNGDPLLPLEIHRVHDAISDILVDPERPGLTQHRIDQRRFAVVDMGDDGQVSQVRTGDHRSRLLAGEFQEIPGAREVPNVSTWRAAASGADRSSSGLKSRRPNLR